MKQGKKSRRQSRPSSELLPAPGRSGGRRNSANSSLPKLRLLGASGASTQSVVPAQRRQSSQNPRLGSGEEPSSPSSSAQELSVCSSSLLDSQSHCGDDGAESAVGSEEDNVKVVVRIRPLSGSEVHEGSCIRALSSKSICLQQPGHEPQMWSFDHVAGEEATQLDMFKVAGQPLVENCMAGYNSSIFAYGQTGAGKTHTMQGSLVLDEQRGLSSRVFEWLFKRIAEEEAAEGRDLRYTCKCSFLEIYNETITDLLQPDATSLQLREDVSRGCFVDGLSEEVILNVEDASALIRRGAQNRRIGHTRMNQESSRSHSVFTCTIESTTWSEAGVTNIRFSRLNLVDLAGSERNKASGATGEHFKEACLINQSLTALGRVIMELVDAQRSRKRSHIPYRDSRLTFLLQDSLGGNAKSMIIANVSPASASCHETLSTLQFVSRAKQIRNKAIVNQDTHAVSMEILKRELQRLHRELDIIRSSAAEPMVEEAARLAAELQSAQQRADEAHAVAAVAVSEAKLARTSAQWAEDKVAKLEREKAGLSESLAAARTQGVFDTPGDGTLAEQFGQVFQQALAMQSRLRDAEGARDQAQHECATLAERLQGQEAAAAQAEEGRTQAAQAEAAKSELEAALRAEVAAHAARADSLAKEAAGLRETVSRQDAEAGGLEQQVASIREELCKRDKATHQERLKREECIQELTRERNTLHADLASAQAELLAQKQVALQRRSAEDLQLAAQASSLEEQLQHSRSAYAALSGDLQAAKTARCTAEDEVARLRQDRAAMRARIEEAERLAGDAGAAHAKTAEMAQLLHAQLDREAAASQAAHRKLARAEQDGAQAAEDVRRLRDQVTGLEAQLAEQQECSAAQQLKAEADLACLKNDKASTEAELCREQHRASEQQQAADSQKRRDVAEIATLHTELQSLRTAYDTAQRGEAEAVSRAARLKHMLGDIDNIIKWAKSPGGTPVGRPLTTPGSFRRGEMPSPAGNHNPLFIAQWGSGSITQSQEWVRGISPRTSTREQSHIPQISGNGSHVQLNAAATDSAEDTAVKAGSSGRRSSQRTGKEDSAEDPAKFGAAEGTHVSSQKSASIRRPRIEGPNYKSGNATMYDASAEDTKSHEDCPENTDRRRGIRERLGLKPNLRITVAPSHRP